MEIDLSNMPPLPTLSKPDRRKTCGVCGTNIRGDRKARSAGICYTCRCSIEDRGRPLVPFEECDCSCSKHHGKYRFVDDGQCGSPVGAGLHGRRHTDCCFTPGDRQPGGDPEFYKLFLPYYEEFKRRLQAERDRIRQEREERWRREGPSPGEVVAEPRSMKANWTPEAIEDISKMGES